MPDEPDEEQLSRYFQTMGRKGAKIRNARLTPERRKEIATKASKAAAEARSTKAKKKKRRRVNPS